jgi:hypothetical protein
MGAFGGGLALYKLFNYSLFLPFGLIITLLLSIFKGIFSVRVLDNLS